MWRVSLDDLSLMSSSQSEANKVPDDRSQSWVVRPSKGIGASEVYPSFRHWWFGSFGPQFSPRLKPRPSIIFTNKYFILFIIQVVRDIRPISVDLPLFFRRFNLSQCAKIKGFLIAKQIFGRIYIGFLARVFIEFVKLSWI